MFGKNLHNFFANLCGAKRTVVGGGGGGGGPITTTTRQQLQYYWWQQKKRALCIQNKIKQKTAAKGATKKEENIHKVCECSVVCVCAQRNKVKMYEWAKKKNEANARVSVVEEKSNTTTTTVIITTAATTK